MPARRPHLGNAAVELGFAAASFVCGVMGAPVWAAGLVALVMLVYWVWSRRATLSRYKGADLAVQAGLGVAVLIVVLAVLYGIGLALRGLFA
jgi:hypothetical protein